MFNNKKYYLSFESQFRNRNLWPTPGEFEILVTQPGSQFAVLNTRDPVSLGTPRIAWTGNLFDVTNHGQTFVSCNVATGTELGSLLTLTVIPIQASIGTLQQRYNYYNRALLKNYAKTKQARIKEFTYLGAGATLEYGLLKTEDNIDLVNGDMIEIIEASSFEAPLNGVLFVPTGTFLDDDFVAYHICNESLGSIRKVSNYDTETSTINIKVDTVPLFPVWTTSHNYSIRAELPSYTDVPGVGTTDKVINLTGGSNIKDDYTGSFLRVLPTLYQPTFASPSENEIRRIVAYNSVTKLATVEPAFSQAPTGFTVEVLNFSYDNAQGYIYTGPMTVDSSPYAIRLLHLIIPNQVVQGSIGGKASRYPYVNVELSSVDLSNQYMIMTNNPTASKVMFKVAVDNIVELDNTTFVNCTSNDMTQVLRVNTNVNYRLKITLPNGQVFNPVRKDTTSPSPSDLLIQISALFELTKATKELVE